MWTASCRSGLVIRLKRSSAGEQKPPGACPDAQAEYVAPLEHLGLGLERFTAQDDIEIPLGMAVQIDWGSREYFFLAQVPGVVTQHRKGRLSAQQPLDGLQGNGLPFHFAGRRRVGQYGSLCVQEVHFDHRVYDHEHAKHVLNRFFVDPAVFQKNIFRNQVLCQDAVELLVHLLQIKAGGVDRQDDVQDADEEKQAEQDGRQPGVEVFDHVLPLVISSSSENLYPTPRTLST
jgi:hypothetical protein